MESHWSSVLVVAAVFTAFSGAASAWGRLQRRRHQKQAASWRALLRPEGAELAPGEPAAPRDERRSLPPDPSFEDSPSLVSDSDSRRAALDETLERMSRQALATASNSADWEDTEPSVTLSAVLPHAAGRRTDKHGSEAA